MGAKDKSKRAGKVGDRIGKEEYQQMLEPLQRAAAALGKIESGAE